MLRKRRLYFCLFKCKKSPYKSPRKHLCLELNHMTNTKQSLIIECNDYARLDSWLPPCLYTRITWENLADLLDTGTPFQPSQSKHWDWAQSLEFFGYCFWGTIASSTQGPFLAVLRELYIGLILAACKVSTLPTILYLPS